MKSHGVKPNYDTFVYFAHSKIKLPTVDSFLSHVKNILGETVNKLEPNNPYIYFYDDGSFEKKIIFVQ